MSNREDYLDSLLKSVADSEEDSLSFMDEEDEFLKKFEQDLMDLDEAEFLKEFEMALEEPVKLREYEPDTQEPVDIAMQDTAFSDFESEEAQAESMENDIDALLQAAMGAADMEETQGTEEPEEDSMLDFGMDFGLEPEPYLEEPVVEDDGSELLDILAGMSEGDDDLAEIGDLLKAHDSNERIGSDDLGDLESLGGMGFADEAIPDEDGSQEEKSDKKKKKKKKEKKAKKSKEAKKSGGFFAKMSSALFGEDDDVEVPESGELGSISQENMEILKDAEKKEKKAQKKQEKKEKKAQKKQEKKEKKEQKKLEKAAKPKKEKAPKAPAEKTKPLPKAPVFLIFVLVASVVVLIYLGTDFVGYTMNMRQSESMYDNGEYVEAYQLLRGMKIKEVHREYYDRTRMTAYVKKELETYEIYIARKMYPEALDALICAVGKYDKHGEEAASVGAGAEFGGMLGDIEAALTEEFGMTLEEARDVYRQQSRAEYTVLLYQMLERAGITE